MSSTFSPCSYPRQMVLQASHRNAFHRHGCVAKIYRSQECVRLSDWLCSEAKQSVYELDLPHDVITGKPSDLPLTYQVHCFIAIDRTRRRAKCAESPLCVNPLLNRSVVLFDDVNQVVNWSMFTPPTDDCTTFQMRTQPLVEFWS